MFFRISKGDLYIEGTTNYVICYYEDDSIKLQLEFRMVPTLQDITRDALSSRGKTVDDAQFDIAAREF